MPTNNPGTSPWTPERDERLRTLWLDGKSATEIAWTFGEGISRNAVIGRVHRLKLNELRPRPVPKPKSSRDNPGQPKVNGIAARAEKRQRSAALAMAQNMRNEPRREGRLPPEDDAGVDFTGRMRFTARRIGHECSWIFGEPVDGAVCCGKPVVEGTEWCAEHRARVYGGKSVGFGGNGV